MYSYSMNRHSDPIDASSNLTQRVNDLHVRSARAQAAKLQQGRGTNECVDCDEPIDAKRKAAVPSASRCAPCQEDHDHQSVLTGLGGRPE